MTNVNRDPVRLADAMDGGDDMAPSPLGRSLLLAGRARRESPGARERVLAAVALSAGVAATTTTIGSTTAASKAAGTATLALTTKAKLLLLGAITATLAAAATAGSVVALSSTKDAPAVVTTTTTPAPTATTIASVASPPPTAVTPDDLPTAAPSAAPIPVHATSVTKAPRADSPQKAAPASAPPSSSEVSPELSPSDLREEAAVLAAARADLARGDAKSASRRLDEASARFPRGMLLEEREALYVRAAEQSGDHERASRLARSFLERHPKSPLRPSVERVLEKSAPERNEKKE